MIEAVSELEDIFREICSTCKANETWDNEDHITYRLIEALGNHFNKGVIKFQDFEKNVNWISYKNKSKSIEKKYGDIALIVNIQFVEGHTLKGVAIIEAKRDFPKNKNHFNSLNDQQLDRILKNAPYSHLLLYCQNMRKRPLFPCGEYWNSNFWISPINTASEYSKKLGVSNCNLERVSLPLSMFLVSRVFWGLDLDFREEIYKEITEGTNSPSFLGVIDIFYNGQSKIPTALSKDWETI